MAYTFNGSTQYLRETHSTNSLLGAWPMTLFCRFKSGDLTHNQIAATYVYTSSPYNGIHIVAAGANAGDPANFGRFGVAGVNSAVSYASGNWIAAAGRGSSNTVFDLDVENTVDTGPTTSVTWQNAAAMMVGGRLDPTLSLPFAGSVASVALWDAVLDNAEVASLVAGFSPRRVRPQSLRWYAPLVRELVVPQRYVTPLSALAATASPTVSDHPRSYGF